MCRILFIYGKNNIQKNLLNQFYDQSFQPKCTPFIKDGLDCDHHLDGIGFCYYTNQSWKIKKNVIMNQEIYNDEDLLQADFLIGHLRNKGDCEGKPSYENTHPFFHEDYVFCHNGYIKNFGNVKNTLLAFVDEELIKKMKGETDSELIFYILLTSIKRDKIPINSLFSNLLKFFKDLQIEMVGNFILANTSHILVSKLSNRIDQKYFSLYNSPNIISSEPLSEHFEIFPTDSIFYYNIDKNCYYFTHL